MENQKLDIGRKESNQNVSINHNSQYKGSKNNFNINQESSHVKELEKIENRGNNNELTHHLIIQSPINSISLGSFIDE